MTRALLWTNQHNAGWPQRQATDLAEGRLPGETCGRSTHHTAAMPRQFSNLARRPIRKENPMKATITLATARATPYAIEHIKPKDLKQIPKEFAAARTMWESGDHAGAKSVLLQLPGGAIGEPLWGGDDLSETDSNDLEPTFDLGEVWWTDNPIPDVAIEMKVTISLKKGVDVKSARLRHPSTELLSSSDRPCTSNGSTAPSLGHSRAQSRGSSACSDLARAGSERLMHSIDPLGQRRFKLRDANQCRVAGWLLPLARSRARTQLPT